jgi:molecular chaperone DnaJ
MAKKDFYELLGVAKTATADELKQAYRKLALQHHPDRNPGNKAAEEKFKEINEAYDTLSNPEKRKLYDQFGPDGPAAAGPGPRGGGFQGFEGDLGEAFSDFFGGVFGGGGGGGRRGPRKGADIQYEHNVSLAEAFTGTQATLRVGRQAACVDCQGTGAKPGTSIKTCPDCRGSGQVRSTRGFFTFAQPCGRCQGQGEVLESPCPECRGQGRLRRTDNITVRIPPGVEEGTVLRVSGSGQAGERGAPAGDLYVVLHVAADHRFEREGDNLLVVNHVSVPLAALGGEVEVPTLESPVRIHIPPGTQSGTLLRVRGSGMPHLGGAGRGDLLVRVVVDIPAKLTKDQKRLFAELAHSLGEKNAAIDESLLKKVFGK